MGGADHLLSFSAVAGSAVVARADVAAGRLRVMQRMSPAVAATGDCLEWPADH